MNLILRKPRGTRGVHVGKGDPLAQLVFIDRTHRRPEIKVIAEHARQSRDLKAAMQEFDRHHREDRNVYKKLVRTRHGQLIQEGRACTFEGQAGLTQCTSKGKTPEGTEMSLRRFSK